MVELMKLKTQVLKAALSETSQTTTESKGRQKLDRLAQIEEQMRAQFAEQKLYEASHTQGYEKMTFDAKQAAKYFGTFPYPYMNGYLHLGKSRSRCDAAGHRRPAGSF